MLFDLNGKLQKTVDIKKQSGNHRHLILSERNVSRSYYHRERNYS